MIDPNNRSDQYKDTMAALSGDVASAQPMRRTDIFARVALALQHWTRGWSSASAITYFVIIVLGALHRAALLIHFRASRDALMAT